jgi:hypothetical protein
VLQAMVVRPIAGRHRPLIWGLLAGILFLALALRLYGLDGDSLWLDEISAAVFSKLDLATLMATISERNDAPLLYVATNVWMSIAGDTEFSLRFPAALLGSLSVLLAYKLGEILWGKREGLLGAFLLALNGYHIRYSQEFRQYALMVFLALLSLILLLKALQSNQWRLWLGFVVSASLGLYNHAYGLLVLLSEIIFALWVLCRGWSASRATGERAPGKPAQAPLYPVGRSFMLALSLFLITLSYLPWLPIFWAQASRHIDSSPTAESAAGPLLAITFLREVALTFSAGIGTGYLAVETASAGGVPAQEALDISAWQSLVLVSFLALFLYGLVSCQRQGLMLVLPWFAIPFVLLCFVTRNRFVHARYVLYILPLYLLLIARGTARLSRVLSGYLGTGGADGKRLLALTVAPALVLGVLSLESACRYHASQREDWRGAARYLEDNLESRDAILVDGSAYRPEGDDGRVSQCLSYYLPSVGNQQTHVLAVRPTVWRGLEHLEHPDGSIWAVIWYPDRPATWEADEEVIVTDFQDLALLRLREPSGVLFRDTVQMLRVLVRLLPHQARFDAHLALAELDLRAGSYQHAELELNSAAEVKPDSPGASQDLDDATAKLRVLSRRLQVVQRPLWRNLDFQIALLGYGLDDPTAMSGSTLELTLWWTPLVTMDEDYTAFIHLTDEEGQVWAQDDKLLENEGRHTSTWTSSQLVREEYQLELPLDIPPAQYRIQAGIYNWETRKRLPVWDEEWHRQPTDAVALGTITVTAPDSR